MEVEKPRSFQGAIFHFHVIVFVAFRMQPSCSSYLTIISAYTSHCSQWQRALAVLEQFRSGMPLEALVEL